MEPKRGKRFCMYCYFCPQVRDNEEIFLPHPNYHHLVLFSATIKAGNIFTGCLQGTLATKDLEED